MAEKHDNIFGLSGFGLEGFAHNPLRKLRHLTGPCYNTAMREIEKAIQFLVSPQKDFIGRFETTDGSSPNALHVGADGVRKLRGDFAGEGPDPFVDTTLNFLDPEIPGSERVSVVLDEDWHNTTDREFEVFGPHCVKGSDGARLAGRLENYRWQDNVHIVRANSINISSDPRYLQTLESIVGKTRPNRIHVGVYGVWTNIKVEYLLFNLLTLPPFFPLENVGVCEPLTAAPEQRWHDAAVEKFNLVGLQVFDNIPDYLKWMGLEVPE